MLTLPWATSDVASAMVIKQHMAKFPSSTTEVKSRVGRLFMKEITARVVRTTVWTMRKFRSSSKQTVSRHFPTVEIKKFTKPMFSRRTSSLHYRLTTMAVRDAASLLVGLLVLFHTWEAWAAVEVNMEDRVEVIRGTTAQIACMFTSVDGVGGMIIQWFYVTRSGERQRIYYQDATRKEVERGIPFTERISVNGTVATGEVVLIISDVQLEDELEYVCLVKTLTDGAGEGRTKLKVFEIPNIPTIEREPRGISVHEDSPSKIGTCEVKNGFPKPNITWYRNNTPLHAAQDGVKVEPSITNESSGLFSVKSELSIKVVKEDKDDLFYCEVTYFVPGGIKMTETSRINITVYYPSTAVNVWVDSPKGKIKEGDTIVLRCIGNGNDASSLLTITHGDVSWDSNEVVLQNVTRLHSGVYHCTSMNIETVTFEEISGNTTVFVNYLDPAVVMPKDTIVVAQREELKATCNALSSLQTHTVWFKNGEKVSQGNSLILKDATFDTAGTYVCVVTVPEIEGMETNGKLQVNVQGPPQIIKPESTEMEESYGTTVQLICHVRGFPAPSINWDTSGGKVLNTEIQALGEKGIKNTAFVEVTSDITAVCNASNTYGTDAMTLNIKARKAAIPPKKIKKEGSGVIIAVLIICILLLAILGSVLYFLYKKGKICGRSGKQDLTKEKSGKDNIVVEMKSDNTEEAVLLGVNGEKQTPSDQGGKYLELQK
ncbi:melanoma cell adhesion molecule b isoform X3 [Micropterus dolomieu]|uniref:melanoma cell adhesion molecule b isoform X3 n=1 Tax=Micropterus dolomieu TaxID=147949 RepID=UPI001E8EC17B|nr:melanoma cell adhesion molecule b isoform X3 [Micropterus dolomieu]